MMKFQTAFFVLLAGTVLTSGTIRTANAQGTDVPAAPGDGRATTVYLSKNYTKSLEADKLFDSDKFVAVFLGFDGDFALFKQAGINEQIYIPKSAILYMRGPGEPKLKVQY